MSGHMMLNGTGEKNGWTCENFQRETENRKEYQTEVTEMKDNWKNTLRGVQNEARQSRKRISQLEDTAAELTNQNSKKKNKI